ncbi:MAG: amidohydrolase family protein [Parvularculaceae bacterium]
MQSWRRTAFAARCRAEALAFAASLDKTGPIHIHAAEQTGEVEEAQKHLGARPVEWLLDNARLNRRWNLVHATHMIENEIKGLAKSGAAVVACPITESNLGDGIFEGSAFLGAGGGVAIGSDSDIRISLAEELRTLEHTQRLRDRRRVVLADKDRSCGRFLLEMAASGGAQALGRDSGRIEAGALADLIALDANHPAIAGLAGDRALDAWIFAGGDDVVADVWAAGRHVVKEHRHVKRAAIAARFNKVMAKLRAEL